MADDGTKVSSLPLSENLDDDDLFMVVEDDISKKAEVGYIRGLIVGSVDSAPTQGSTNLVQSGGVYTALAAKANTSDLATVATSGSYDDLSDKPTIPDELADLTDDATHRLVTDEEKEAWDSKAEVEANPSGTATADLETLKVDNVVYALAGEKVYGEASGEIASFSDGADDKPVKSLTIGIESVQAGSGDPSPQNERPISGWTGAEVDNVPDAIGTFTRENGVTKMTVPWEDGNNSYSMPFNVMAVENVKDENDNDIDVMTFESHFVLPFDTVFDAPEAIVASDTDLPAGDYYFKIVNDAWGGNNDKYVSFTLDSALTAGQQIRKRSGAYNVAIENCTLGIFTSGADLTGTELAFTVSTTQPSTGTNLGQTDGTGYCNHWHCVALGYNRWKYSAVRQFLNSTATAGNWWTQQHKWDVKPEYADTKDGYLYGFESSLIEHMKVTKVVTARNTVFNSGETLGGMDETYDRVFLASLEQMYVNPQISGEGETWEYYKLLNGTSTPYQRSSTYADLIKYGVDAKTTARTRWLRSCYRGYANREWCVASSGSLSYYGTSYDYRVAPCLRIEVPYKKTLSWQSTAGTVYGGRITVYEDGSGELSVTDANIASYAGETINEPWISSMDKYVQGATPTTGAQVVYKLATPQTYTFPAGTFPTIKTLLGENNMWANTGDSDVVYQRDLNIVINDILRRLEALENA